MNSKTDNYIKYQSKTTYILIAGLLWLALGLFGLIFDPTKNVIIITQMVLGLIILIYYFWLKLK